MAKIVAKSPEKETINREPLNEKLAKHGPFMMNNETQILEAMRDYQMGKMGVLIED